MTEAKKPEKQNTKPRRKWLRWIGLVLCVLLFFVTVFHRPIIIAAVRYAVIQFGASQHLRLEFDLEGSGISDLIFKNLRASPDGRTPVDSIHIDRVRVTYSIPGLLRRRGPNLLTSCEISNANLVFKDIPGKPGEQSHLGEDMHNWFFPPVFFLGRIEAENVNILSHTPAGDFVLQAANGHIAPGEPGWLRVETMRIPGLRPWKNIQGKATVDGRNLVLQDVVLAPDLTVSNAVSAPSDGSSKASRLTVQAKAFGGDVSGEFVNPGTKGEFDTELHLSVTKFGLEGFRKFLNSPVPISGVIEHIDARWSGDPDSPKSWTGIVTASIESPAGVGALRLNHSNAKLVFENGAATLDTSEFSSKSNKATGQVHAALPAKLAGLRTTPLDGHLQIAAPDLSESTSVITHGSLLADGHFSLRNNEFTSNLVASAKDINTDKFDASTIDFKVELDRPLVPKHRSPEYFDDFRTHMTGQFQGIRFDRWALDSGSVTIDCKKGWLKVDATDLKRGTNAAVVRASCHLPRDFSKWPDADFLAGFWLSAPNATAFNAEPDLTGVNGQFETSGYISHNGGLYDGAITAAASKITYDDFSAESFSAGIDIAKSMAEIHDLALVLDSKNGITGSGRIDLRTPFDYSGKLQANVSDLSVFNSLLAASGTAQPIGGSLTLDWEGSGQVARIQHSGTAQVKLTGGKYGAFQPISAEIAGQYSPETISIPTLHVLADKTDFKAQIDLRDTEIKIHDILLQQQNVKLLQGELMLPLDLRTPTKPDTLIPTSGRIFANLSSDEINLDTLLIRPKVTSPLKGTVKLSVNADGPLDNLIANFLVRGRNLQSKAATSVAPGTLELNCDLKDDRLEIHGSVQQRAISPLKIDGSLPFPVKQLLKDRKIDDQTPVKLAVKLDKSPVTIIGQLAPQIRYVDGWMEIDAHVGGTIAKPAFGGAAKFDLTAIRLRDPTAPAVNGFVGDMEFSGNQLSLNRFGGEISGGPFNLTGKVVFAKLTQPVLDLRLTSQNALLVRNESLTVRADSDMKIAGPFDAANVTGEIGITKSKFFREVEILPIELPGRPAPKPSTEMETGFSLKPPLSHWKFNVAIKSKDPFLVRGNLTHGAAHIDLKLVGSGESPSLEGMIRLDNFVASLPFSRLNIEYGYLYFSAENPFVPTLDIQGTSSLRDYNIRVYISGTPEEPVSVFTSDPPLPQEQIVALLGTGATAEELTGRSDVLAGRAAVLLVEQLYRKIFKKKRRPQENESFLTRFQFDPGAVNPRTGKQEVSAKFKISDQFYLIGDLDEQGGVRGQVSYLLRFK